VSIGERGQPGGPAAVPAGNRHPRTGARPPARHVLLGTFAADDLPEPGEGSRDLGLHLVNPDRQTYVLDTGPLSYFARSQWLGVLKALLADVTVVIPDVVEAELRDGAARHSYLQRVLDAGWVGVVRLDKSPQITAFTYYTNLNLLRIFRL